MRRSRQGLGRGGSRASIEESDPDSDLEFDDEIFGTGEEEPLMPESAIRHHLDTMRSDLTRAADPYVEEMYDRVQNDVIVVGSVPLHEAQAQDKEIEEHKLLQGKEAADLFAKRHLELHSREEKVKTSLYHSIGVNNTLAKRENRRKMEADELEGQELQQVFRTAENELRTVLDTHEAVLRESASEFAAEMDTQTGLYKGANRRTYKVEWIRTPQPIKVRVHTLRAPKDKIPAGRYVLKAYLMDSLGGRVLSWKNHGQGPSSCSGSKRWHAATNPVRHSGHFDEQDLRFDDNLFMIAPSRVDTRPCMVLAFELFVLRGSESHTDRPVGWGCLPLVNSEFSLAAGRYRVVMMNGGINRGVQKWSQIHNRVASDLDNWLCNLYITVSPLAPFMQGMKEYEVRLNVKETVDSDGGGRDRKGDDRRTGGGQADTGLLDPGRFVAGTGQGAFGEEGADGQQSRQTFHGDFPGGDLESQMAHTGQEEHENVVEARRLLLTLQEYKAFKLKAASSGLSVEDYLSDHRLATAEGKSVVQLWHEGRSCSPKIRDQYAKSGAAVKLKAMSKLAALSGGVKMGGGGGGSPLSGRSLSGRSSKKVSPMHSSRSESDGNLLHEQQAGSQGNIRAPAELLGKGADFQDDDGDGGLTKPADEMPRMSVPDDDDDDDDEHDLVGKMMTARLSSILDGDDDDDGFGLSDAKGGVLPVASSGSDSKRNSEFQDLLEADRFERLHTASIPGEMADGNSSGGPGLRRNSSINAVFSAGQNLKKVASTVRRKSRIAVKARPPKVMDTIVCKETVHSEVAQDTLEGRQEERDVQEGEKLAEFFYAMTPQTTSRKHQLHAEEDESVAAKLAGVAKKMAYIWRELPYEAGLRAEFWHDWLRNVALIAFMTWFRLFTHYMGQYYFLYLYQVPVIKLQVLPYTVVVSYHAHLQPTQVEVFMVCCGMTFNILLFAFTAALVWAAERYLDVYTPRMSACVSAFGMATVLDPLLILIVDVATENPLADHLKLMTRYRIEEGSGIAGVFMTVLIDVSLMTVAAFLLYVYHLYIHKDGCLSDVYERITARPISFFVPDDMEVSERAVQSILNSAKLFRGADGRRRKVAVTEFTAEDDADHNYKEVYSYMAIYDMFLDGDRRLYRQFLRLPSGSMVEIFPNLTDGVTFGSEAFVQDYDGGGF